MCAVHGHVHGGEVTVDKNLVELPTELAEGVPQTLRGGCEAPGALPSFLVSLVVD